MGYGESKRKEERGKRRGAPRLRSRRSSVRQASPSAPAMPVQPLRFNSCSAGSPAPIAAQEESERSWRWFGEMREWEMREWEMREWEMREWEMRDETRDQMRDWIGRDQIEKHRGAGRWVGRSVGR